MIHVTMLADLPYRDTDMYRGGVIPANHWLVQALAKTHTVKLTVLSPCHSVRTAEERHEGNLSIVFWPWIRLDGFRLYKGLRRALHQVADRAHAALVHASHEPAYIFAALHAPTPSVVTVHGVMKNELPVAKRQFSLEDRFRQVFACRLEAHNFCRIRNLIATTSETAGLVKERSPQVRIFRIPNAIDERFFSLPDEHSRPVILFVGWVSYRKGVHLLLQAVRRLLPGVPALELRIVGSTDADPAHWPSLSAEFSDLISAGRLFFLGCVNQEQLYNEMSRCAVLCLPSLAESAPMVIAQAMAAGKPVVASRVGGVPEMVEHGVTGMLAEPGNVEQLTQCLQDLLVDSERRVAMGRRARSRALQTYAPDAVAGRTVQAYKIILGALNRSFAPRNPDDRAELEP